MALAKVTDVGNDPTFTEVACVSVNEPVAVVTTPAVNPLRSTVVIDATAPERVTPPVAVPKRKHMV